MRSRARSRAGLSGRLVAVMGRRGYTARTAASMRGVPCFEGRDGGKEGRDATNRLRTAIVLAGLVAVALGATRRGRRTSR